MRIYEYGARRPTTNLEFIETQLRIACEYQRYLVSIERKRRQVVDRLYERACPSEFKTYAAAKAAAEEAAVAVSRARSARAVLAPKGDPDARQDVIDAKEALAAARKVDVEATRAWWAARKAATPRLKRRMAMCDRGAYARAKVAYKRAGELGLGWGTRLRIGESVERAAKAALAEGSLPHLPKFDGGGALAVQLQGGLATDAVMDCEDTQFRIEVVTAEVWQKVQGRSSTVSRAGKPISQPVPGSKRSAKKVYALAHIRIGSEGRAPIWGTLPIILHRPLPEGGVVKWAQMHAHKVGARTEWKVQVTVDAPEAALRVPPEDEAPTLAVNLGWRQVFGPDDTVDHIRVAYAVGSDGYTEEVSVPADFPGRIEKIESIRSIRDRLFETAKKSLGEWIEDFAADRDEDVPAWLGEAAKHIDMWRSPKRLFFLLRDWRSHRFDGDTGMFNLLEAWWKKDHHLRFWECDGRAKALRYRKECYRVVAARWAERYPRILLTDMDLRDFAEAPDPMDGRKSGGQVQRRTRTLAAPSELAGAIKNAASTRGTEVRMIKGPMTQTCIDCGAVMKSDTVTKVERTCPACAAVRDQDYSHCRAMLASGKAAGKGGEVLAGGKSSKSEEKSEGGGKEEKKVGRWVKRRSQSKVQVNESTG